MKYTLASQSPRRKELLSAIIPQFEIISSNMDETIAPGTEPGQAAMMIAQKKGEHVAKQYSDSVVISADTIVVCDGLILTKPEDETDAESMLNMLSGKTHEVITGVCIIHNNKEHVFAETTEVTFRQLTSLEIKEYIATGEPMDKAGAYGIQGSASKFVTNIKGSKTNVIGLPVSKLKIALVEMQLL